MNEKFNSEYLRNKIESSGLTREEFAQKIYYARQSVQRWLTGEFPETKALVAMSSFFDVPIENFLLKK